MASDADLFFEATLFAGRKMCLFLERRRGVTFPSGELGELDLDLFVNVGLSGGLGLPVRGREDAERDRNTSFKVQVADL